MFYRYFLILTLFFSLNSAFAQKNNNDEEPLPYRRFRIDLNLLGNFSWFGGNNSFGGVGFSVEPKYSLTKHWSVGLLAGMKLRFNPLKNVDLLQANTSVGKIQSSLPALLFQYQFTGDFHLLTSSPIRPYLGLGVGVLTNKPINQAFNVLTKGGNSVAGNANKNDLRAFFLLSPRFGVDFWHIRVNVVYDWVVTGEQKFGAQAAIDGNNLSQVTGKYPQYSSLTGQIIFYFGGGRKNK